MPNAQLSFPAIRPWGVAVSVRFAPARYTKDVDTYQREANDEIALFVQIETPEAVSNARAILETKGIDGVFIGNGDLANFMNQGQPGSQAVQEIVDDLIKMQCGAQLLTIGGDMSFLANGALAELSCVRRLLLTAKHWLVES